MSFIKRFERNTTGRDFVVGDIHGCFYLLEDELLRVEFDEEVDRLFSVGDLVDRGPQSEECLDWIAKPWFHAVCGNHEQMAIGVHAGKHDLSNYLKNGGSWFLSLENSRQALFAGAFSELPLLIEVDHSAGRVGIVHADVGESWDYFVQSFEMADSKNKRRRLRENAQWSRSRIQAAVEGYATVGVEDLAAMIVGHTPVKKPTALANVIYLDTGSYRSGKVTVMELGEAVAMRTA